MATTQRATYAEIRQLLEGLASRFGWQPIMEGDLIIGVQMDGQSVTLEPGGQFELSGAPVDTLHKTCAEVNQHLYQVQASCSLPGSCVQSLTPGRKRKMSEYVVTAFDGLA